MSTDSLSASTLLSQLKLQTDNTKEFWNTAWEKDLTRWRNAELRPVFTRHLYVCACNAPEASNLSAIPMPCVINAAELEANLYNGAEEEAVVRDFLKGKAVLVPLCGDTPVVRYMADHGATTVVGVDLAPEGLRRQREAHFDDVNFTVTPVKLSNGGTATMYEGVKDGCTIRLFEGDFLALATAPEFCDSKIDFVYDRASMMAMHPSMRDAYVATIAAVLTPEAGLIVERAVRDEGDVSGPPFTFFADQVKSLYENSTGRPYDVETMLVNRWSEHPEPGAPHYFELLRVYPQKA